MYWVLDSSALIAYFRDEPGAEVVAGIFVGADNQCVIHALNLCEVYYDFFRAAGGEAADNLVSDVGTMGISIREDLDIPFWKRIGEIKATIRRISLADATALTLAQRMDATLLTSDHHEMDQLRHLREFKIQFIR